MPLTRMSSEMCGSSVVIGGLLEWIAPPRVWVRAKVQLPAPPIGYVGIELGRREVGVAEHLLHRAQIGTALEQVRRERVAEQVRVDTLRVEARLPGQLAEDQEGARARQRAAARVQEQLRPVPCVEERPTAREVAAQSVGAGPAERDDALLAALADAADEPPLEVDAALLEPDRLADAEAGAVEQLDERGVAERARRRAGGGVDQALRLGGGERPRQRPRPARQLDRRRRVVRARAEQLLVAEERPNRGRAPGDRRRGEPLRALLGDVAFEVGGRRRPRRPPEEARELLEVA